MVKRIGGTGTEKMYYALYKRDGKLIETKLGRQYADDMTLAKAVKARYDLIEGRKQTRQEIREAAKSEANMVIWTVGVLWEEYKRRNPDVKAIKNDQNRFENHLASFKNTKPNEITPTMIDDLRLYLGKAGRKPGTIRNVMELLRRIISFGIKKGLISGEKVYTNYEMPKLNNETTEDLSPEQLKALLDTIHKTTNNKAANMMLLALYTGMRRGEMFNLKWDHIDWERGFINLVGLEDGMGAKSGQSERIPMNEMARELLRSIPQISSPYVFPGRGGSRLVDIRKQADALKKEAGLPTKFRPFHGLRHVYASMLASSGKVSMYELQKLMTHKSPAMTQRYAHLRDEALRSASEIAGDVVNQMLDRADKEK